MAVITVSRQFGSHGEVIARMLADQLGYEYVDKELLAEVAQLANATPSELEAYDERGEGGLRAFLRRSFVGSVAYDYTMYYPFVWGGDLPPAYRSSPPEAMPPLTQRELIRCFNTVIGRLWQRGNVVLIGRGSQIVLREKPQTIHLRFVTPLNMRCRRVMEELSLSESAAMARIKQADRQRAQYLKRYYHANWTDSSLYHLIINTGRATRGAALAAIMAFLEQVQIGATVVCPLVGTRGRPGDGPHQTLKTS